MFRRIGVLVSLAVVAAMFMGVSAAQAAQGDTVACTFGGIAHVNPAIPPPPLGIGQEGVYDFNGEGLCSGRHTPAGEAPNTLVDHPVTVSSAGGYYNYVCGTGWAFDYIPDGTPGTTTVSYVDPDDGETEVISAIGHEIKFAGGKGKLQIGGLSKMPHSPPGPGVGEDIGGKWTGAGAVIIEPVNSPRGCVTEPVSAFIVTGAFEAAQTKP